LKEKQFNQFDDLHFLYITKSGVCLIAHSYGLYSQFGDTLLIIVHKDVINWRLQKWLLGHIFNSFLQWCVDWRKIYVLHARYKYVQI